MTVNRLVKNSNSSVELLCLSPLSGLQDKAL